MESKKKKTIPDKKRKIKNGLYLSQIPSRNIENRATDSSLLCRPEHQNIDKKYEFVGNHGFIVKITKQITRKVSEDQRLIAWVSNDIKWSIMGIKIEKIRGAK